MKPLLKMMVWVDYILTTANSWKTPIKDFTLIIDKRKDLRGVAGYETQYVSMCWDGPVKEVDAAHLLAHKIDFVPEKEFRIAFFSSVDPPDR